MPAAGTNLVGANYYTYNGQWLWTSDAHPGMWNPQKLALAPRIGAAIKIDEGTALRIGYARYLVPSEMTLSQAPVAGFETVSFLEPPYFGVKGYQNTSGLLEGVPQQTITNPYPANQPAASPSTARPPVPTWAAAALRCSGIRDNSRRPSTIASM